jgi:hypothetical protein
MTHHSNSTPLSSASHSQDDVFSIQKAKMDYLSWRGIENRTGVEKKNVCGFVIQQFLDNAADYEETHSVNSTPPEAKVVLKKEANFMRIVVGNSNTNSNIFSKKMVQNIFDVDSFYSSKRNQFKITRGALGDALKELLCIPYVLAREAGLNGWDEPLTIRNGNGQAFLVRLIVNRGINQSFHSEVEELPQWRPASTFQNYTEIEVRIPMVEGVNYDYEKVWPFVSHYSIFNTHIGFHLQIDGNHKLILPPTQPINHRWKNHSSIYYYRLSEFHDFILGLEDNDSEVYNVLYKTFREGSNLKKSSITQMTVGQLKESPQNIDRLYKQLKNSMSYPASLALPFDITKKKDRINALRVRVQTIIGYGKPISSSDIKYKSIIGTYNDSDVKFPFLFEIAIMRVDSMEENLIVCDSLNCSTQIGKHVLFQGIDEFEWTTPNSKYIKTSYTLFDILNHFGYSSNKDKCKKPHALVIANLISPRVEYHDYGKTQLYFKPFAKDVVDTVIKVCQGGGRDKQGRIDAIEIEREIIRERKYAIDANPNLIEIKPWTQSTVFYNTRKKAVTEYGYKSEEIDAMREYLTSHIKEICEDDLGTTREALGIYAADRAQLYFDGQWRDVGIDEIEYLSNCGIDIIIIEKEAAIKQLGPYADEEGIALLNTRGFLVDYALRLSVRSAQKQGNVAIISDRDVSGYLLALKAPNVYRIGIDGDTAADFGLNTKDLEEKYNAPKNHLKALKKWINENKYEYADKALELVKELKYIEHRRIEIDVVMAAIDDNRKFWNWILQKLRDRFDRRNYLRAFNPPEYVSPKVVDEINDIAKQLGIEALEKPRENLMRQLSNIEGGFLFDRTNEVIPGEPMTVPKYKDIVSDHSRHIIESNERVKPFLEKLQNILDEDKEEKDNDGDNQ